MNIARLAAAGTLALILAAGAASAQERPANAAMMQMMLQSAAPVTDGRMGQNGARGALGSGLSMQDEMMIEHIEGRIAFLRAELKITAAQDRAWQDFALALRANAKRLDELRTTVNAAVPGKPSTLQQLDRQERWIAARLDGIRAIRTTLEPVYAAMSDPQKQRADELLPVHLGLLEMGPMVMSRR